MAIDLTPKLTSPFLSLSTSSLFIVVSELVKKRDASSRALDQSALSSSFHTSMSTPLGTQYQQLKQSFERTPCDLKRCSALLASLKVRCDRFSNVTKAIGSPCASLHLSKQIFSSQAKATAWKIWSLPGIFSKLVLSAASEAKMYPPLTAITPSYRPTTLTTRTLYISTYFWLNSHAW